MNERYISEAIERVMPNADRSIKKIARDMLEHHLKRNTASYPSIPSIRYMMDIYKRLDNG